MKKLIIVLVALTTASLFAEGSDITGKWTTWKKGDPPLVLQVQSSATALTGTVRIGSSPELEILDGKVVGSQLSFKALVPDGDDHYAMMFSGRRSGGRIDFKCDVEVNVPGKNLEFGPACLAHIAVRRASR